MKWFTTCFAAITLITSLFSAEFPIDEVVEMAGKDTELRLAWIRQEGDHAELAQAIRTQEIENTLRLKEILIRYGLPSGYEGDAETSLIPSIWQLVHRSSDLAFQQDFLGKVASAGDLWADQISELTDRILLRQGKSQKYGTHFHHENGQFVAYPIEDLEALDALREEIGENSFDDYAQAMQMLDRAVQQDSRITLRKIILNSAYEFTENPDDYLYYATFTEKGVPQTEGCGTLAFEDPSLAVAFALIAETKLFTDASYESADRALSVYCIITDPILGQQTLESPLYLYLVPRDSYQVHEGYAGCFYNRVLTTTETIETVAEFAWDSPLGPLLVNGSKIILEGPGSKFEYQNTSIEEEILSLFFFDCTLENEAF